MNTALFRKIHEVTGTDLFNMDSWESRDPECGTARCIAGWAIHFSLPDGENSLTTPSGGVAPAVIELARRLGLRGADRYKYAAIGADLLGITRHVASELFYADNETAAEVVRLAADGDDEAAIEMIMGHDDDDYDEDEA